MLISFCDEAGSDAFCLSFVFHVQYTWFILRIISQNSEFIKIRSLLDGVRVLKFWGSFGSDCEECLVIVCGTM